LGGKYKYAEGIKSIDLDDMFADEAGKPKRILWI